MSVDLTNLIIQLQQIKEQATSINFLISQQIDLFLGI